MVAGGTTHEFLADQGIHFAYPFVELEHCGRRPLPEVADFRVELVDNGIHLFRAFHAKPFTLLVKFLMFRAIPVTFVLSGRHSPT